MRGVVLSPEALSKEPDLGLCGILEMLHLEEAIGWQWGGRRSLCSAEGEQWRKRRSCFPEEWHL